MSNQSLHFSVESTSFLADTLTPVSVFLKLREKFAEILLLESSDYRGSENSFSFICFNPLVTFLVDNQQASISYADGSNENILIDESNRPAILKKFIEITSALKLDSSDKNGLIGNGFFGHTGYDAVQFFEDIKLSVTRDPNRDIPNIRYSFYEFILAFNHYKNEVHLIKNSSKQSGATASGLSLADVKLLVYKQGSQAFSFQSQGPEESNITDEQHIAIIERCKKHIARGDVFQIVPSRRFSQKFQGDEFNVYRTLRSINPSPYLFYFDYGNYRLFGSSPEAQLVVKDGRASIYPIAGTYPRRADRSNDLELAKGLEADPKENAEHIMLVDLARNDLSKHCDNVNVEIFKQVQFYSHVIHLVSKVSGDLIDRSSALSVLADTFPAGTLSGAPKYRAMQLIDQYEVGHRSAYGGCIGFISPNGDLNHAIVIRSFLSKNNELFYQAGSGIVADSDPLTEVNEVKSKLGALKRAIEIACSTEQI